LTVKETSYGPCRRRWIFLIPDRLNDLEHEVVTYAIKHAFEFAERVAVLVTGTEVLYGTHCEVAFSWPESLSHRAIPAFFLSPERAPLTERAAMTLAALLRGNVVEANDVIVVEIMLGLEGEYLTIKVGKPALTVSEPALKVGEEVQQRVVVGLIDRRRRSYSRGWSRGRAWEAKVHKLEAPAARSGAVSGFAANDRQNDTNRFIPHLDLAGGRKQRRQRLITLTPPPIIRTDLVEQACLRYRIMVHKVLLAAGAFSHPRALRSFLFQPLLSILVAGCGSTRNLG
jgi:hypothetical protein